MERMSFEKLLEQAKSGDKNAQEEIFRMYRPLLIKNAMEQNRFDEKFHVQAYIQADTAWYYDQKKLWELRGRVRIRNVNGMIFNSEELFWDGLTHELYSYKFSRLVTPERTLQGTYFRSDEKMTHYTVSNSKGSFVKSDMESEPIESDAQEKSDTATVEQFVRLAATPRAATNKNMQ